MAAAFPSAGNSLAPFPCVHSSRASGGAVIEKPIKKKASILGRLIFRFPTVNRRIRQVYNFLKWGDGGGWPTTTTPTPWGSTFLFLGCVSLPPVKVPGFFHAGLSGASVFCPGSFPVPWYQAPIKCRHESEGGKWLLCFPAWFLFRGSFPAGVNSTPLFLQAGRKAGRL